MADRALGALAAAFGSAAVEGRLLRAGVIIRKGPHRDGAPETHRHPGPDRTSWARTIANTSSDALPVLRCPVLMTAMPTIATSMASAREIR
jgi:hypothetical protein